MIRKSLETTGCLFIAAGTTIMVILVIAVVGQLLLQFYANSTISYNEKSVLTAFLLLFVGGMLLKLLEITEY